MAAATTTTTTSTSSSSTYLTSTRATLVTSSLLPSTNLDGVATLPPSGITTAHLVEFTIAVDDTFPADYPDTFASAVVWLVCDFSSHTRYDSLSDIQQCYSETNVIIVSRTWLPDFGARKQRKQRRNNAVQARPTWTSGASVSDDAVPLLIQFYVQTTAVDDGAIVVLDGTYVVGALAAAPPSLAKGSFLFQVVHGTTVEGKFAERWSVTAADAASTSSTTAGSVLSDPAGSTNSSQVQVDQNAAGGGIDTTMIGLIVSIVAILAFVLVGIFVYQRRRSKAALSESQLSDLPKRTGIVINSADLGMSPGNTIAMNHHADWIDTQYMLNQLAGTTVDPTVAGQVPAGATWEEVAAVLAGHGSGAGAPQPIVPDAASRVNLMPPLESNRNLQRWDRTSPTQGQDEWATVSQALASTTTTTAGGAGAGAGMTASGLMAQTDRPALDGPTLGGIVTFGPSHADEDAAADEEMQRTVTWANEVDAEERARAVTAWGQHAAKEGIDGVMHGGHAGGGPRSATAWDEELNNELMNFQRAASQMKRSNSVTSIRDADAIENFVPTLIERDRQDGYITAGPFSDGRSTVMSDGGYLDTVMHPMGRGGAASSMSYNGYLSTMPGGAAASNYAGFPPSTRGHSPNSIVSGAPSTYPSGRPKDTGAVGAGAGARALPDVGHLQLLLNMRDMCDNNITTANDPQARIMARQARDGIDKQLKELRSSPTDGRASVGSMHYHPPGGAVAGTGVPYVPDGMRSVTPNHFLGGGMRM